MIAYFDSSALVKKYVQEAETQAVRDLLKRAIAATSRLTVMEESSALARRAREGHLSIPDRDHILAEFATDLEIPIVIQAAQGLLLKHSLRAADAIHLASGVVLKERLPAPLKFVVFDTRLAAAAAKELGRECVIAHSPRS